MTISRRLRAGLCKHMTPLSFMYGKRMTPTAHQVAVLEMMAFLVFQAVLGCALQRAATDAHLDSAFHLNSRLWLCFQHRCGCIKVAEA
jgi:hypothetical protein